MEREHPTDEEMGIADANMTKEEKLDSRKRERIVELAKKTGYKPEILETMDELDQGNVELYSDGRKAYEIISEVEQSLGEGETLNGFVDVEDRTQYSFKRHPHRVELRVGETSYWFGKDVAMGTTWLNDRGYVSVQNVGQGGIWEAYLAEEGDRTIPGIAEPLPGGRADEKRFSRHESLSKTKGFLGLLEPIVQKKVNLLIERNIK